MILYYEMQIYRGGSNRGAVVRNIEVVSILFSTYQSLILRFEFVKVKALKCEELSRWVIDITQKPFVPLSLCQGVKIRHI